MVVYTQTCKKCGEVFSFDPGDGYYDLIDFENDLKRHLERH